MEQFQWKDQYKLGIEIIDTQHKRLVQIIAELGDLIPSSLNSTGYKNKAKEKKALQKILDELTQYAHFHFATEEKYFSEFHYKRAKEHEAQHENFRKTIDSFTNKLATRDGQLSMEISAFLENWFKHHLLGFDRDYVETFHKHGL